MDKKAGSIIVAIAIGFLTGVALAAKLGGWLAWVLGPITGSLVGYLTYEFKTVLKAIPKAWRLAISHRVNIEVLLETLKLTGWILLTATLAIVTLLVTGAGLALPGASIVFLIAGPPHVSPLLFPALLIFALFGTMVIAIAPSGMKESERPDGTLKGARKCFWLLLLRYNPVTTCTYWPIRFLTWNIPRIPKAIKTFVLFFWHLFRLIHSQERLIVMTWAFVGVIAWLFSGALLVCGLGAILGGFLSYAVIGQRILKTIPRPAHSPA